MQEARPAKQAQRQQTRARLIEAALHVFAAQGYDHTTVEEISLAAGYSKGAYYFHFDSKEDVLLELLHSWIEKHTARLRAVGELGEDVALAPMRAAESLLARDDGDDQWLLLSAEIWAQSHRNDKVRSALQAAHAEWTQSLEKAFEQMARDPRVALTMQPRVAASLVVAAFDGLVLHSNIALGPTIASQVLSALLSAIVVPKGESPLGVPSAVKRTIRRKASSPR